MFYQKLMSGVLSLLVVLAIGCGDSSTNSNNIVNQPPAAPSNPTPAVGDTAIARLPLLSWSCSDIDSDTLHYQLFLKKDSNLADYGVVTGAYALLNPSFQITSYLDFGTKYYWKIDAFDNDGDTTSGSIWNFTTIPFDSNFVLFPDTSFRRAIVSHLSNVSENDSIYVSQVDTITALLQIGGNIQSGNYHIASIEGIQYLISLDRLYLYSFPQLSDISPLQNLTSLTDVSLHYNNISDLSPLQNLTNIYDLDVSHNALTSLTPLHNLTAIQYLNLSYNTISGISELNQLSELRSLEAASNSISDLSAVANMPKLELLILDYNSISEIDSLANLDSLQNLALSGNSISDVSALQYLPSIHILGLSNNNIVDIKPLVDNGGIGSGDFVHLETNPLSDSSLNVYIPQLEARGVTVSH